MQDVAIIVPDVDTLAFELITHPVRAVECLNKNTVDARPQHACTPGGHDAFKFKVEADVTACAGSLMNLHGQDVDPVREQMRAYGEVVESGLTGSADPVIGPGEIVDISGGHVTPRHFDSIEIHHRAIIPE